MSQILFLIAFACCLAYELRRKLAAANSFCGPSSNSRIVLERCAGSPYPGVHASAWAAAFLLVIGIHAHAQSVFPLQALGTTAGQQAVTVTATTAGTVNQVQVLTQGVAGLDFAAGNGFSCKGTSLTVGGANGSCQQSVSFTPAYPGLRTGAIVLLDGSGNVLGTSLLAGMGKGGLGNLVSGNFITVAGVSRQWTATADGIPAIAANLEQPSSIALDGAGNLYIADSTHFRIRKVTVTNSCSIAQGTCLITTIAGNGIAGFSGDGSLAVNANLLTPSGVAVDGAGNLYIADSGNNRIRMVSATNGVISTVAGTGVAGFAGDNSLATSAKLNQPWGVTLDSSGNLYIADALNQRIRKVAASTNGMIGPTSVITTVVGTGAILPSGSVPGSYLGDGGLASGGGLNHPYAVAFDANNNMYIPDSANHVIRLVTASTGIITTFAGTGGVGGYSGDGGPATSALLDAPSAVSFDPAGDLYIADTQNSAIRKVYANSKEIQTVAVAGSGSSLSLTGALGPVNMYAPIGLCLDGNGSLYIADYFDMTVHEILGNVSILDYTGDLNPTPIRQGSQSAPISQTVENDGNDVLDLTSFVAAPNALVDPSITNCGTNLALYGNCVIGAIFAPATTPAITSNQTINTGINVADLTEGLVGSNSPLQIEMVGIESPVNSTTTVLTSTPNPSGFGQNVTFSATVTTGAGALTGTITLTDTFQGVTTTLTPTAGLNLNSAGVTNFTISTLAVGIHKITACYINTLDPTHLPSCSTDNAVAPLTQTVDEATSTTLISSANPSAIGTSVTFTATVTASNGGGVAPDGTVIFSDGSTKLISVALSASGVAAYTTSVLANGLNAMTATYGGDASKEILGSISAVLNQEVLAPSTSAVTSTPNPSIYGNSVTFTITVTPSGTAAATGVVNLLDGGQQIGQATLVGTTGVGTFATSSLAVGSHSITAVFLGSSFYAVSTSPSITQVVNQAQTITSVLAAPNPSIAGLPVHLTASVTVSAGTVTPTGTVSFMDGTVSLGSAPLGASGAASITPTLAPGVHVIVATYSGDTNDNGSVSPGLTLPVVVATTATALTASPSPSVALSPVTLTARVSGNGLTPSGTVSFSADGVSIGSVTLDATGTATFAYSGLVTGTHTLVASYGGDTDNAASTSSSLSLVVGPIPTATALGSSTTTGTNPSLILVAATVGASGPTPTGTIIFQNSTTVIGTVTLDSSGVATLTPNLATGNYSIVAYYSGDALHSASQSKAVTFSTTPTDFNLTVTPAAVTLKTSQNATVTVALTSQSGFTDTIGLGCASLPAAVNCHFSTISANLAANGMTSVQLTIDTNNPLSGGSVARGENSHLRSVDLAGLFLPFSLFFGWMMRRFRRRYANALTAALLLASVGLLLTGCSGITQSSAAPGTYVIQVTGIGANSDASHYQNVTLTITQ